MSTPMRGNVSRSATNEWHIVAAQIFLIHVATVRTGIASSRYGPNDVGTITPTEWKKLRGSR
jgi:hypothetical protein